METTSTQAGAGAGVFLFIQLAIVVFYIVTMWKIFAKAGKPGWACLIPIYNFFVMLDIAGKPAWWFLLLLSPFVNIVVGILVLASLAANFGKGGGFVAGLIFLPIIFYPILAFGSAQYKALPPATA